MLSILRSIRVEKVIVTRLGAISKSLSANSFLAKFAQS
jgi:hypothetical protein